MRAKAKGNQGSWFAQVSAPRHPEVDGKSLPCVWDVLSNGTHYHDDEFDRSQTKFRAQADALIQEGFAVMRRRDRTTASDVWRSAGYIAVFRIANVVAGEQLTFDFVQRVCDLD